MEELKNLQEMINNIVARFDSYKGEDFILPSMFKEKVKLINSNTIVYNKYSAIIETAGNQNGVLKIYMPNQWFYIASYFTDYYNELIRYKKTALKITSKERLKVLNGNSLTESEKQAVNSLECSNESKQYLIRFITDYSWWEGAKTIDRGDFYVSPILSLAKLVNASQSFVADLCAFLADKPDLVLSIIDAGNKSEKLCMMQEIPLSLQQIFYGAPGTGKSRTIKDKTQNEAVIRTTFHPDTDYSTFVGSYKPTTKEETVMTVIGKEAVPVKNAKGEEYKESKIIYEFVPQAFLQAYISAWKKYAKSEGNKPAKQYLIIEEINRGNCAQIFGDLFQLLDRNDYGFSEYPITTDADMKKHLKKAFEGLDIPQMDSINAMFIEQYADIVKAVLEGDCLLLPDNLYIWATMNTSDQSLFPIDSAFKRRWDWKYIPISNAHKEWMIKVGNNYYDWWQFIEKINTLIGQTTSSEDKKLGYFFCKANKGMISDDKFVSKVIFYLWNDVFKDYELSDNVFKDTEGHKLTFDKFYTAEGRNSEVIPEQVELFLHNLGLEVVSEQQDIDPTIIIKVNDKEVKKTNAIPYTTIEEYVKLNPDMSAQQVIDIWRPFKKCFMRTWIVCSKEEHDEMEQKYANYSYEIVCGDGNSLWVNKDGWMYHPKNINLRDTITEFIQEVNTANLGIIITETTAQ
mgnify:FL=1